MPIKKYFQQNKSLTLKEYIPRDGETSETYIVPVTDNTGEGSYTCRVTVSTVASSESTSLNLGSSASGICLS